MMNVDAQSTAELPRLVVNILVDQLRADYLETFSPLYGEDGFKRLMTEARFYADSQQPFVDADCASAAATLVTGAVPRDHGIPSKTWLSRQTLQPVYCVDDTRYKGVETFDQSSPNYLLTSALSDELKQATARKSLVYSIAPERDVAVLMAAHVADGAYWIDDQTGAWCSSSFYGKLPSWIATYDRSEPLSRRIGHITWESVFDNAYPSFLYYHALNDASDKDFKHTFSGDRRYREFKSSALVNDEVANLAEACLTGSLVGRDALPDLLCLGFYAGTFDHQSVARYPSELQDTYVRLDRALAKLFAAIDRHIGMRQVLVVVSSTGYDDAAESPTIAAGTFNMQRASMLLNMFLAAKHGQAQYVEATYDKQIYLDHKLIEQRQLHLNDILVESEEFLTQMEGVRDVFSLRSLVAGAHSTSLDDLRNAWAPTRWGDLIIEVHPGWTLTTEQGVERVDRGHPYIAYPLFFLGADVNAERINTPVSMAAIAPTLARCLRIRAPNGSRTAPLVLK